MMARFTYNILPRFGLFPGTSPLQPAKARMIVAATDPKIQTLLRDQIGTNTCAVSLCWIPKTSASTLRSEAEVNAVAGALLQVFLCRFGHTVTPTFAVGTIDALHALFRVCHPTLAIESDAVPCGLQQCDSPACAARSGHRREKLDAVTIAQSSTTNCYQATCIHAPDPREKKAQRQLCPDPTKTLTQLSMGSLFFDRKKSAFLF